MSITRGIGHISSSMRSEYQLDDDSHHTTQALVSHDITCAVKPQTLQENSVKKHLESISMLPNNLTVTTSTIASLGNTSRPYLVVADSGCVPYSAWMDINQFIPDTIRWVKSTIAMADRESLITIEAIGTVKLKILTNQGKVVEFLLANTRFIPSLKYNLLSEMHAATIGLHCCKCRNIMWSTDPAIIEEHAAKGQLPTPEHIMPLSTHMRTQENMYAFIACTPHMTSVLASHTPQVLPDSTNIESERSNGSNSNKQGVPGTVTVQPQTSQEGNAGENTPNAVDPTGVAGCTLEQIQHVTTALASHGVTFDAIKTTSINNAYTDTIMGPMQLIPNLDDNSTLAWSIDKKDSVHIPQDLAINDTRAPESAHMEQEQQHISILSKWQRHLLDDGKFSTEMKPSNIHKQIAEAKHYQTTKSRLRRSASIAHKNANEHFQASSSLDTRDLSVADAATMNLVDAGPDKNDPFLFHPPMSLTWFELHTRTGHQNLGRLEHWAAHNPTVKITGSKNTVSKCPVCVNRNQTRVSFPGDQTKEWPTMKYAMHWTTLARTGALWFGDTAGPYPRSFMHGHKYAHGWVSKQGYIFITTSRTKERGEVLESLMELLTHLPRGTVKHLQTDGGTEFINEEFKYFCLGNNIRHTWTIPDTPEMNSNVERAWRTVVGMATGMLAHCGLPASFWAEAITYAAHCYNTIPRSDNEKSPTEELFGFKPSIARLREFGCTCVSWHPHKSSKDRFKLRGVKCIYLGWSIRQNGYLIYDVENGKLLTSHTVAFFEGNYEAVSMLRGNKHKIQHGTKIDWDNMDWTPYNQGGRSSMETHDTPEKPKKTTNNDMFTSQPIPQDSVPGSNINRLTSKQDIDPIHRKDRSSRSNHKLWDGPIINHIKMANDSLETIYENETLQDTREREQLKHVEDAISHVQPQKDVQDQFRYILMHILMNPTLSSSQNTQTANQLEGMIGFTIDGSLLDRHPEEIPIPEGNRAFEKATHPNNPYRDEWSHAIIKELRSHIENATWTPCVLPTGRKAIKIKWVFVLKNSKGWRPGSKVRFKARLVAKGFTQIWGEDYNETYAPVVRSSTFRTIVSLAAHFKLKLTQSDISTAFVQAPLEEEEIYIELPHAARVKDPKTGEPMVGKLNKALYGLKQAPRLFNNYLIKWLKEYGFVQYESDKCLFTYDRNGDMLMVGVYVDDLLIASNNDRILKDFHEASSKQFDITHFPNLSDFLGIQLKETKLGYTMHMENHCRALKGKFPHINFDSTPPKTPMSPDIKLKKNPENATEEEISLYRSMIGTALYLSTQVRLDIAFAVSALSQYMLNPSKNHTEYLERVIQYLYHTPQHGLEFSRNEDITDNTPYYMIGLVDASYGGNMESGRCHTGFVHITQTGYINFRSVSQKTKSTSSSHAEAKAAFTMSKETLVLRGLLHEIKYNTTLNIDPAANIILVDNKATVDLMHEPTNAEKSRHWFLAYNWVKERQLHHELKFAHISGEENVSDMLTKPVSTAVFNRLNDKMISTRWCSSFINKIKRNAFS